MPYACGPELRPRRPRASASMSAFSGMKLAQWIEPFETEPLGEFRRPAYHLATEFDVAHPVARAILRLTAHGLAEAFINNVRVGEDELLPGFTAYRKRLEVHSFDVSHLIVPGANALGALLSDGWWRGQHSSARRTNSYGDTTAFLAELVIDLASGQQQVIATGPAWRSTRSHILEADLIAGEVHDLLKRVTGWCAPGADRTAWDQVRMAEHDAACLVPAMGPPCRRVGELRPANIRQLGAARHVIDFGQNINGWVRLADTGPAGTKLTLVYGETLSADGDVTQDNVSHADRWPERPFQTDVVISAGEGTPFEPRHSTKGFRYVRLEGYEGTLVPDAITAQIVHSELVRAGDFTCSDERLNKLHAAADWSFRANACVIPTDCPQRERAGWTGDYQTFVETAAYLYDVTDFSLRWLHDVAAEQWPDGTVLNYVPDPHDFTLAENAQWRDVQGSSGWGDAACHVPWELYRATGRVEGLPPLVPMMRGWVDFALRRAAEGRHSTRTAARPEALSHERYIWDTGFHFGEWTEPGEPQDPAAMFMRVLTMDHGPTATAFLYRSTRQYAQIAEMLGLPHSDYAEVAQRVRDAWRAEFLDADGRVQPQTQANLVRALAFDLMPAELRQGAANDLAALVRSSGNHLGTGFLATPFLLPALADHGYLDLAYAVLMQDTPPSWLHMIDKGATTMWERWDAFDSKGEGSLNHYSKGSVASFLYRYVAGLQVIEPGYRRFRVAPRLGGGLTHASTWHQTPFGRIGVAWKIDEDRGTLDVTVPDGTEADIELPDGARHDVGPGQYTLTWRDGLISTPNRH